MNVKSKKIRRSPNGLAVWFLLRVQEVPGSIPGWGLSFAFFALDSNTLTLDIPYHTILSLLRLFLRPHTAKRPCHDSSSTMSSLKPTTISLRTQHCVVKIVSLYVSFPTLFLIAPLHIYHYTQIFHAFFSRFFLTLFYKHVDTTQRGLIVFCFAQNI